VEASDVLEPEVIDVAGRGQRDGCSKATETDRQINIAVEQPVDQAGNERVAGADAVYDFNF
jgi:hypothetical protein